MKKVIFCAALVILGFANEAKAQHPCDAASTSNPVIVGGSAKVGFCWNGKASDGTASTMTGAIVYLDGVAGSNIVFNAMPTLITPTANASGWKYYETASITFSNGSHTVVVTIKSNEGEGAPSPPFAFGVNPALPTAPVIKLIVK